MIVYKEKSNWKKQSEEDYKELEKYKESYKNKITLYNIYLGSVDLLNEENVYEKQSRTMELNSKINFFQMQIDKIDRVLRQIESFNIKKGVVIEKEVINNYNLEYKAIKDTYISNSLVQEETTSNYINSILNDLLNDFTLTFEKIKQENNNKNEAVPSDEETKNEEDGVQLSNNDTLLVSEVLNKVILPYTAEEVKDILINEGYKYQTAEEVIEDKFTRPFSDFKFQFISRYRETMKLAREREHYSLIDAIALAVEMIGKRFLHPAIIAACRTLNELDVYLDCLEKNELDDFKIFKINYQLYPAVVKKQKNEYYKEEYDDFKFVNKYYNNEQTQD